jgi:3-dehydroquinate dehydratase I
MSAKFCLPIIVDNLSTALSTLKDNLNKFDYFELWVDYINSLSDTFLESLDKSILEKIIIVTRRKNLETPTKSLESQKTILSYAINIGCLIDVDVSTQLEGFLDIPKFKDFANKQIIASYHNYQQTPPEKILHEILGQMLSVNPFIYKFSCYCNSELDTVKLLEFGLQLKEQKKKYIVLGMGEHGLATRTFGAIWGNEMAFTPLDKSQSSAAGQLTRDELSHILMHLT